jgi:hypothetical protein
MPSLSLFGKSETLEERNARLAAEEKAMALEHEKKKTEIMKYRGYTEEQAEEHLKMKKDGKRAEKGLRALGSAFATERG